MKEVATDYIGKEVYVKIDRPIGSSHPKYPDYIYLVNYGYVPNTISGDGEELDCYILGEYKPLKEYTGTCIAVIRRLNDDDDKLVIVANGKNYTDSEIRLLTDFQEMYYESEIIRNGKTSPVKNSIKQEELRFFRIDTKNINLVSSDIEINKERFLRTELKEFVKSNKNYIFICMNEKEVIAVLYGYGMDRPDGKKMFYIHSNENVYDVLIKATNYDKNKRYKNIIEFENDFYMNLNETIKENI